MQCPTCIEEGERSRVYDKGSMTTLMYCAPYWDEDGRRHHHDMNTTTTGFSCSNGHTWTESSNSPCPTCGDNWA